MIIEKIIDFQDEMEKQGEVRPSYILMNRNTLRDFQKIYETTPLQTQQKIEKATNAWLCIYNKVYKSGTRRIVPDEYIILFNNIEDITKALKILDEKYVNLYAPPNKDMDKTIKYWVMY